MDNIKDRFDYSFRIYKDRIKFINEEKRLGDSISSSSYNFLLRAINDDIYDSINKLKEWNSFSIRKTLYINYVISCFTLKEKELKNLVSLGLDNKKIALDNYKRVFEGIDITYDYRCFNNIKTLIEQLYNAEVYTSNYEDYMQNLIARLVTNNSLGDYNYNYIEEMEERREKVLSLEKDYLHNR